MANLNELDELTKALNNMIKERETFVPNYYNTEQSSKWSDSPGSFAYSYETVDEPYDIAKHIREEIKEKEQNTGTIMSYMALKEHGQPYKNNNSYITRMAIIEHGLPYRNNDGSLISKMAINEHGQPYRTNDFPVLTLMAVKDHGRPYRTQNTSLNIRNRYILGKIDNINDEANEKKKDTERNKGFMEWLFGQSDKEKHDQMKITCTDYCPNIAGKKCGRPGCS